MRDDEAYWLLDDDGNIKTGLLKRKRADLDLHSHPAMNAQTAVPIRHRHKGGAEDHRHGDLWGDASD